MAFRWKYADEKVSVAPGDGNISLLVRGFRRALKVSLDICNNAPFVSFVSNLVQVLR